MKKTWRELLCDAHLEHAEYDEQYAYIKKLETKNKIQGIKASKFNGREKPLYQEYKIIQKTKDLSFYLDELKYHLNPHINIEYYSKHLDTYDEERDYVIKLSNFLDKHINLLDIPVSCNERSFQIWQEEKFLKEKQGKTILKHCNISIEKLNYYETVEPLSYYSKINTSPQTILIIENKDTFYSMCKFLLSGEREILGREIGTLIYGAGKGIWKSFSTLNIIAEPYLLDQRNTFLYVGDLDYEGIYIYENLLNYRPDIIIEPFIPAYHLMLEKSSTINLPKPSEKQNKNITNKFLSFFEPQDAALILQILEDDHYIPQEIVNITDLK